MSIFHNNILAGASGAGGADAATYVDDVFSCFVYEGDGASSRSVQNGLDLSGEGGLVWFKARDQSYDNALFDTERGANERFNSNAIGASATETNALNSFDSDGFTLGTNVYVNGSGTDYVSWSFRKAPGFFDVVSYTGNGTAGRTVSHSLGSTPGMMIIKKSTNSENWIVYHRSIGATKFLTLNGNGSAATSSVIFNNTEPTSTEFTLGLNSQVNENGDTYVAYIFAHDDQSFGTDSDEAIIKCGSYTGGGSSDVFVDLGFEPQWVMIKSASQGSTNWTIADNMRGITTDANGITGSGNDAALKANANDAEQSYDFMKLNPTGFTMNNLYSDTNNTSQTYIYIAIRRPHKPPTTGTDVFAVSAAAGNSDITTNFPVDLAFQLRRSAGSKAALTRLQGKATLEIRNNNYGTVNANAWYESNTKFLNAGLFTANSAFHLFKRAPGFLDIIAYSGTGADQVVNHGLGVTPELMILKARTTLTAWRVFYKDGSTEKNLQLSSTGAAGNIPVSHPWSPSATTFRADQYFSLSASGHDYIAAAFATLDGISKVGTYSGTGSDVDVDCGFSAGARFVLIKRTDSSSDWYFYDTARGIASGNDPYILNPAGSSSDEVTNTDYIDPLNSGFTVTSSAPAALNVSGGTYLFLAIA